LISVICDNALISGFAADRRPVTRDIVEDVCRDFDLTSDEDDDQGGILEETPILEKTPVLVPIVAQTGGTPPTETEPVHRGGLFEQFRVRRRFSFF
jgi:hypothetical protein